METCKHCGNVLTETVSSHYRHRCQAYKDFTKRVSDLLTKEYLTEHYVEAGKSVKALTSELGLDKPRLVERKLQEHGIRKRTLQEAKKMRHHVELAKATSLQRYGVEFHLQRGSALLDKGRQTSLDKYGTERPCQSDEVKAKIVATTLERYGVENVFSDPEIKARAVATTLERYGVDNPWKNKDVILKCQATKSAAPHPYVMSSRAANAFFGRVFESMPASIREHVRYSNHRGEFGMMGPGRYFYYDFVVTGGVNLVVEYHGDYYHANPRTRGADWYNKKRSMTAAEIWANDAVKLGVAHARGFTTMVVWESDDVEQAIECIGAFVRSKAA